MKKRILTALSVAAVSAFLLAGCTTANNSITSLSGDGVAPIDLTSTTAVNSLCGDTATETLEYVETAKLASPDSGKRNSLKEWGVSDPKDDSALVEIIGALKVRASDTECQDTPGTATEDGRVGVESLNGALANLPLVTGTDATLIIDSTTDPTTPPLLDASLRFTAQTLSWEGLVERVGNQQWFKDGINSHAAETGFTWDDVLKFASANKVVNGKIQGVNALAIQIFNRPDLTDEQARDEVRRYITPEVEKSIGITTVDELPIQRINNGFISTLNGGTAESPKMSTYFDTQHMVRLSLMPIKFDSNGKPVSLDGSRGAGMFIDCANLHWVPKAVWKCTDETCAKPPVAPPPVCQWNPNLPPDSPDCLQSKDWGKSPVNPGWTPLEAGPLTDGNQSQDQQDSGDTRGNVIDDQVPNDTGSGDTTPDVKPDTIVAPDATPGGDDRSDDVVDETVTNQDDGGTKGDTCIADPDTGEKNC